jgi:hypothetical protein
LTDLREKEGNERKNRTYDEKLKMQCENTREAFLI